MSLVSLAFLALLLTGILLGGMAFFSFCVAPMAFRNLPVAMAGKLIRHIFRVYDVAGAILAIAAAAAVSWSIAGLLLALVGVAFLFRLLWLRPAINRNHEKGEAGDATARATFEGLHRASVALNGAQMLLLLAAFALIATGWV
jgi:fatty acid desaturase